MNSNMGEDKDIFIPDHSHLTRENLIQRYKSIREWSNKIAEPLEVEDYVIQSMADVSPTKWHLAHVSWFFETFVLSKVDSNYKSLNPDYTYLFNSYYVQVGKRFFRPQRGMLSRPTVKGVYEYRKYVDDHMLEFLENSNDKLLEQISVVIDIGLNHEQQHQELMLTDLKNVFSMNPLNPVYREKALPDSGVTPNMEWTNFDEGIFELGSDGKGFFYDNERPSHKVYLQPFKISNRLVTNGEYLEFIEEGGYKNTPLWLSNGATRAEAEGWEAPLYWEKIESKWHYFTLSGFREIDLDEPVCHVSKYEADAYARWKGVRLPTEAEWERAVSGIEIEGNFVENENFHPAPLGTSADPNKLHQLFGDVWEWTLSDYSPYPGYKTPPGAIGEYNGKFMSEQIVLRGGSCATSKTHIRKTYRNFFYPKDRWQFMGIRLADNI